MSVPSRVSDPQGECTSKTSNGDWWVVASGRRRVLEYAHGGTTPLKTLNVAGGEPAGCTVDPTTGNLAVTILGTGNVVLFTGGSVRERPFPIACTQRTSPAYDDKGDLFVDGITSSDTYGLVELPKGSSTFVSITLSPSLGFPGELQWHDNYSRVSEPAAVFTISQYMEPKERRSALPRFAAAGGSGFRAGM